MVRFQKFNLQDNCSHFGKHDIVFCRNIFIYFSAEFKQDILRRIAMLLRPDSFLFLGASESIIMYTSEYNMIRHAVGLYYRVRK